MVKGVILNVRPANYRERFHAAFACVGWPIVDSPALAPETMGAVLPDPAGYDAIIFTSQVALELLDGSTAWKDKTAYAVGAATAEAARRAGFSKTNQTGFDAKDLAAALSDAGFRRALYPSAEDVSSDVSLDDPVRIHRLAIYRMTPAASLSPEARQAVRTGKRVIIPIFSRRSARTVARLLRDAGISAENSDISAVAISQDVFAGDPGPWQRRAVADNPTLEAVAAKTAALAAEITSGAS